MDQSLHYVLNRLISEGHIDLVVNLPNNNTKFLKDNFQKLFQNGGGLWSTTYHKLPGQPSLLIVS